MPSVLRGHTWRQPPEGGVSADCQHLTRGVSSDCQLNAQECTNAIGPVGPNIVQTICEVASLPTAQPRTQGVSTDCLSRSPEMYKCYWPCGIEHSTNNLRGCVSTDRPTSHTRRLYRLPVSITRVHGVSTDCQLNVHKCTNAIGPVGPNIIQTICEVASLPTAQPRTQIVSSRLFPLGFCHILVYGVFELGINITVTNQRLTKASNSPWGRISLFDCASV